MPLERLKFPKGFLWGAATSAYQTEGGNEASDWWAWERSQARQEFLRKQNIDPESYFSGIACDSYNRFDEDFALAEHLNHNTSRFGIEWARIEPKEGEFSEEALSHYEKVLQSAKAHGLTTFVTLHHYTLPLWFANKGGFTKKENIPHFLNYVRRVAGLFGEYVDFWITINEPEVYSSHSYFFGKFPPAQKSFFRCVKVVKNLIRAHNRASEILKFETGKPVGLAYQLSDLQSVGWLAGITATLADYLSNKYILNRTIGACDFIGVNYYNHHHVGLFGFRKKSLSSHQLTDVGWGIHPDGIERVLKSLKGHRKPIYVTENGIADSRDLRREKFIKDHLYFVHRAIQDGADVRGYLYWSLIDNFEWADGFAPRFGLIEIDREDLLRRKVRYSALKYAEICRDNSFFYEREDKP